MKSIICNLIKWHDCVFVFCEKYFTMILLLIMRLWLANVFFTSGLAKIASWSATLYLFEYEYAVPFIPFELAAYAATAVELGASVLIALGLFTRLATLPLFFLTLVIQLTYENNIEYFCWMFVLLTIMFYGASLISIDAYLAKKFKTSSCT